MLPTIPNGLYKPVRTRLGEWPFRRGESRASCRTATRPIRKSDYSSAKSTACAPGTHRKVNLVLASQKGAQSLRTQPKEAQAA
jgi:hypothetical protein